MSKPYTSNSSSFLLPMHLRVKVWKMIHLGFSHLLICSFTQTESLLVLKEELKRQHLARCQNENSSAYEDCKRVMANTEK